MILRLYRVRSASWRLVNLYAQLTPLIVVGSCVHSRRCAPFRVETTVELQSHVYLRLTYALQGLPLQQLLIYGR